MPAVHKQQQPDQNLVKFGELFSVDQADVVESDYYIIISAEFLIVDIILPVDKFNLNYSMKVSC